MLNRTLKVRALAAAACATALLASAGAQAAYLACAANFDGVASGTLADSAAPANCGVTFREAVLTPNLDANGDPIVDANGNPIPDQATYKPNPDGLDVLVRNPAGYGRGTAPSASNMLDAVFQDVLLRFANPLAINNFSITLDKSSFGALGTSFLLFLDAQDNIVFRYGVDLAQAGTVINTGAIYGGLVTSVLLPSSKLYDDLQVSAVPVPMPLLLLPAGLGVMGFISRRRLKT